MISNLLFCFIILRIIISTIFILFIWSCFTPVLADSFSLELEQVFASLLDSFKYSGRSK